MPPATVPRCDQREYITIEVPLPGYSECIKSDHYNNTSSENGNGIISAKSIQEKEWQRAEYLEANHHSSYDWGLESISDVDNAEDDSKFLNYIVLIMAFIGLLVIYELLTVAYKL